MLKDTRNMKTKDKLIIKNSKKKIMPLSQKEVEIIAWLEFYQKYFFTSKEIKQFFRDKSQRYNTIKNLLKKKRIIKINQDKYYLVPIKAKSGSWSEHPFVIIDEICNGENYYINGWASANYWRLTDQIPSAYDVYTTNRQGIKIILNTKMIFHRAKEINKSKIVIKKIKGHEFIIMNKKNSKKWMKSRE